MAYGKDSKGSAPNSGTGKGGSYSNKSWEESVQGEPKDSSPAGSGDSKIEGPNPGR